MKKYKIKIKRKNSPLVEEAVAVWKKEANNHSDVLGWYTGAPSEKGDIVPEQDGDDL